MNSLSARLRLSALVAVWSAVVSMAATAEVDYPRVEPGRAIEFPRDEGSHPQFRIEWWYLTGWVETDRGDPLGFQVAFFRARPGLDEDNPSRFAPKQLLFAHVAVSDPKRGRLLRDEKAARAGFGLAEAAEGSLDVHIDDWSIRKEGESYRVRVPSGALRFDLQAEMTQPPLLQGEGGYSRKGRDPASASYYYSLPHLEISGSIAIEGREHSVQGVAWFDHEWSSALMEEGASGWDWVGLNLDDGGALMAFRMRDRAGGEYWAAATLREPQSDVARTYGADEIEWEALRRWRSPRTGTEYVVEWRLKVGERSLILRPLMDDQENDARGSTGTLYWEGAVHALDERGQLLGRGYLELTGYGSRVAL